MSGAEGLFPFRQFALRTDRYGRRQRVSSAFPSLASRSRCKQHAVKREQEYPDSKGIPIRMGGKTVQGVVLPSGRKYAVTDRGNWVRVQETDSK